MITNCEYYVSPAANTYYCLKCKHGFSGKVREDAGTGYMEKCLPITNCNAGTFSPGVVIKTSDLGANNVVPIS